VGEARHERAGVELVYLFLEQANAQHLLVHTEPKLNISLEWASRSGPRSLTWS
jgi:hypothetical protein